MPNPVRKAFNASHIDNESHTVVKSPLYALFPNAAISKIGIANIRYFGQFGFLGCSLSLDNFEVDSIVGFLRFS